jgi:heme/copper-type cytochrome/quinol oxidase subunit 2
MVVRPTADMRLSFADGLFWSSVACCAIAQIFILRSIGAGGRRRAPDSGGSGVPQPRGVVEMIWALVPAIALAALLMVTWRAMRDRAEPAAPAAPVMEAER